MVYQQLRQCQLIWLVCILYFLRNVDVDTVFGEVCEWAFSAVDPVFP